MEQTRWFLMVGLGALLTLIVCLYQWRTRLLARRCYLRFTERLAERERLVRASHDSLLQNLQGLILHFHSAVKRLPNDSETRSNIEAILDRADSVVAEARGELMDREEQDIRPALARFGRSLQQQFGPRFQLILSGEVRAMNNFARHELYSIGREALFNAYQHAHAKRIEIELIYGRDAFKLFVRDDGSGIDQDVRLNSGGAEKWGLAGMREGALALDGTFEFWSRQEAGTEIVIRAPARQVYAPAKTSRLRGLLGILGRSLP